MARKSSVASLVERRKSFVIDQVDQHLTQYEADTRGQRKDAAGNPLKSGYTQVLSVLRGAGDSDVPSLENVLMAAFPDEALADVTGDDKRTKIRTLLVEALANHQTLYAEPQEHTFGERSQNPGLTVTTVRVGRRSIPARYAAQQFTV